MGTATIKATPTTSVDDKKIHQGDLIAKPGVVYGFEEITGDIYARGADTKTAFPKLTSVGGHIDAMGDFTTTKQNDNSAASRCRSMLIASFAAAGFSFADGVLARIVSQRGGVARVVVCGKVNVSYLVTDGEAFAEGAEGAVGGVDEGDGVVGGEVEGIV